MVDRYEISISQMAMDLFPVKYICFLSVITYKTSRQVPYKKQELLTLRERLALPLVCFVFVSFPWGRGSVLHIVLVFCVVFLLCLFSYLVLYPMLSLFVFVPCLVPNVARVYALSILDC